MRATLENKEKNNKPVKRNKIKTTLIVLLGLAVILVVASALLWKMLFYAPPSYQPAKPVNPEQVSPYLTHKLGPDFINNIQLDDPFNILVEQQGLNDIVARWNWPMDTGIAVIETPVAVFEPQNIVLMARMNFGQFPVITTITFSPTIDDQGLFVLNLRDVQAGAVNITPMATSFIVSMIDAELNSAPADEDTQWLSNVRAAVLDNTPFDPVFPVDAQKDVRLSKVDLEKDKLTIQLTPINK